jgi:hypothetical protein
MRNYFTLFLLSLAFTTHAQTAADVFRSEVPITLIGLDFSKARFISDEALQREEPIHKFMLAINYLLRNEADKYDFSKALRRDSIEDALEITMDKNKTINAQEHVINDVNFIGPLSRRQLDEIVASYDYRGKDGIGLMLIVDKLDKYRKAAFIWYTFIDMSTKKILFTEYKTAGPAGFGPRNYWARTVYQNIIDIKAHDYKAWKTKYESSNLK